MARKTKKKVPRGGQELSSCLQGHHTTWTADTIQKGGPRELSDAALELMYVQLFRHSVELAWEKTQQKPPNDAPTPETMNTAPPAKHEGPIMFEHFSQILIKLCHLVS